MDVYTDPTLLDVAGALERLPERQRAAITLHRYQGLKYREIAELLDMSDRIRDMILQRKPGSEIKRAAKEEGMTTLREAALSKVFAGLTTLHEINKVTFAE